MTGIRGRFASFGGNFAANQETIEKHRAVATPAERPSFDCDPSWISTVESTPALDALDLDPDRNPQGV